MPPDIQGRPRSHVLVGVHGADPHPHRGPLRLHPRFLRQGQPPITSIKSGRSTAKATPDTSPGTRPPSPLKGSRPCWKALLRCLQSMLLHLGNPRAICLCQLYACLVYFITAYLDGFNFWVSPLYFWAYFIGAHSSWVVIPTLIATRSWKKICAAIHQSEKQTEF